MAEIINGKLIAENIRQEVKEQVSRLKLEQGKKTKLVVILVGEDPGSTIYVRNKERACAEAGIESQTIRLSSTTKQEELNGTIEKLNNDQAVDGILVQFPLPKQLSPAEALLRVSPEKDVDGLHPLNMGKLLRGEDPYFLPCTPSGCLNLILSTGVKIAGKEAVIVGRSNLVGKPMAIMLLKESATVTVCHSKTKDLAEVCRRGDILVAAVGSPELIRGDMVKEDAVVIDVGMNRLSERLVGDVDFKGASAKAGYITPVPGGVGPMTIAMLLKNTLAAARRKAG